MPRSARRQASCAYEFGLIPSTELPLRSVGPEPAMMTAMGTRPAAPRGIVRVAASPKAPLRIVYGVSIATAGGVVSARAADTCGTRAAMTRLRTIMLLSLPQEVRLHDRDSRGQGDRGDEKREEHAPRREGAARDHEARDHEQPPRGAMHLTPHGVAREGPRCAHLDEPVRLDAIEVVGQT